LYVDSGATDPKKIGQGKGPAQNPPPMGDGDWAAWAWFLENCAAMDVELGLTSMEFRALRLKGAQKALFKMKLREIHAYFQRADLAKIEREKK
jgi:hypothetical protein